MKIFKYPLKIVDEQEIYIHEHAKILTIQVQDNIPCIWARINPNGSLIKRKIAIHGTGHECPYYRDDQYIGTFQYGPLVFHAFDLGEE